MASKTRKRTAPTPKRKATVATPKVKASATSKSASSTRRKDKPKAPPLKAASAQALAPLVAVAENPRAVGAAPHRKASRLSDADRALLQSVIERAALVHETVESTWTEFGRWVFVQVFGEDSTSAIDHRGDNPVYEELLRLADGPKVRIRAEDLERATLCAAYDKRLNNDSWRALNYGRKWRLLRLDNEKLLRKGAQYVLASNLDTRGVESYVRNVLAERETGLDTRVNFRALTGQLRRVTQRVTTDAFLKQLASAAKQLDDEQRERVVAQIEAARDALDVLHKKLRAAK